MLRYTYFGEAAFLVILGIIVGFIVSGGAQLIFYIASPTGAVIVDTLNNNTCPDVPICSCNLETRGAKYILDKTRVNGNQGIFGDVNKTSISLTNLEEEQGSYFTITIDCYTEDNKSESLSHTKYVAPGKKIGFVFDIQFDKGERFWCDNFVVESLPVGECKPNFI
ncbi:MAG: hypothetical protein V1740_01105 [Candidatus Woesearchaeota archaeon]